jgi:hypothetical protein
MPKPSLPKPLIAALLEIARVRFELFHEQFGRDPEPDEPLLFDKQKRVPTAPTEREGRMQVLSAALASNVDPALILGLLGYKSLPDA